MFSRRSIFGLLALLPTSAWAQSLSFRIGASSTGGSVPIPPEGFAYLVSASGAYIVNADGAFILAVV